MPTTATETAQAILDAANVIERQAQDMKKLAEKINLTQDLSLAPEFFNLWSGIYMNARIDLIVTRPIRALKRLEEKLEKKNG